MLISNNGIGKVVITLADNNLNIGDIVCIGANNTAKKSNLNEDFVGVVVSKRAGYVAVQIKGCMTVKYATAPNLGVHFVSSHTDNRFHVVTNNGRRAAIILNVNRDDQTADIVLL